MLAQRSGPHSVITESAEMDHLNFAISNLWMRASITVATSEHTETSSGMVPSSPSPSAGSSCGPPLASPTASVPEPAPGGHETPPGQGDPAGSGWKRIMACNVCRQRKLKCDRQTPACGGCVARGHADSCSYKKRSHDEIRREPVPLANSTSAEPSGQNAKAFHQHVDRIEAVLTRALDQLSTSPLPNTPSRAGPSKLALANQLTASILYPSSWTIMGGPACSEAVLHALSVYPSDYLVKASCQAYFESAGDVVSAVNPTAFWQKFDRHRAYVRDVRDRGLKASGGREDVVFLALVLAMTVSGAIFGLDSMILRTFERTYNGRPIHTFMGAVLQLLSAVEHRNKPTKDTVRIELVVSLVFSLSPTLWAPSETTAGIVQNGIGAQLNLNPSPESTIEEFYDHMRLWVSLGSLDAIGTLKARRAPILKVNDPNPTPSFLFSSPWDWPNDNSGFWSYPIMYRFHLTRLCLSTASRASLDDEAAYSLTLRLQNEFDQLHASLPSSLKVVLDAPTQNSPRVAFNLTYAKIYARSVVISWHHPYYVQGWRSSSRRTSVDLCYQASKEYVETFLDFCEASTSPTCIQTPNTNAHQNEWTRLPFRVSIMLPSALSITALLRHHLLLTELHPHVVAPSNTQERERIYLLLDKINALALSAGPGSTVSAPLTVRPPSPSVPDSPAQLGSYSTEPNEGTPLSTSMQTGVTGPVHSAGSNGSNVVSGVGSTYEATTPVVGVSNAPTPAPRVGGSTVPAESGPTNWENILLSVPEFLPLHWPSSFPDMGPL